MARTANKYQEVKFFHLPKPFIHLRLPVCNLSAVVSRQTTPVYLIIKQKQIMETQDKKDIEKQSFTRGGNKGRALAGLIIVAVGAVILLQRMDIGIPHWLTSWPMIPIAAGLFIGAKHSFRNPGWIVPVIVGSILLMTQELGLPINQYWLPIAIICVGIGIIVRPKHNGRRRRDYWQENISTSEDLMDTTTIFGNIKKNIITKDFKGGDITAVFGGTELNFMRADIQGKAVIDITMIFGGAKLIVPAHWKIQTEDIVTIFGGVEDKRPLQNEADDSRVLVLKGTCLFGGIDIKSY
jgi:predicted membrane protein